MENGGLIDRVHAGLQMMDELSRLAERPFPTNYHVPTYHYYYVPFHTIFTLNKIQIKFFYVFVE